MAWSKQVETKQGRKKILVKIAKVKSHQNRFYLYNSGGKYIPTMWTLYDNHSDIQYFLYGVDWKEAQKTADGRIKEILAPAVKKLRK